MSAFTKDQYAFIVEQLAEGDDAINIAGAFKVRFKGVNCTVDDVAAAFRDLASSGWKPHHDAHRLAFETNAPLGSKKFRVAFVDKMARSAASRGAIPEAVRYVELIEKIDSGFFSGKGKAELAPTPGTDTRPITAIEILVVDPKPLPDSESAE
jgi:hypothetical protein